MKGDSIIYRVSKKGYWVLVFDTAGNAIHNYTAGNCHFDPQAYVSPGSPEAVPLNQIKEFAKQTASEIAGEFDVPESRIRSVTDDEDETEESIP